MRVAAARKGSKTVSRVDVATPAGRERAPKYKKWARAHYQSLSR
jgi:hypothetical protein